STGSRCCCTISGPATPSDGPEATLDRMNKERRPSVTTRAIHVPPPPMDQQTPSVSIFQTSTFRFDTSDDYAETISFRRPGYTYTRGYGNPTLLTFERA